jgi:alkanesulfonate monooxygenase SsuD/methylene tetrahydromethanopterin reductase-like flavin-dependent oxidoreductase (luciferase family)
MEFGYFTLSDNHYENNARSSNQFVGDTTAEALYADKLGMSSAWIGEHHFNSLGVLSCPDIVLAYVAANTTRIRLAPAVTVLPLHNPIRVAEQWATLDLLSGGRVVFAAGRGYDRREYLPFHVSFEDNQGIFEEGLELVRAISYGGLKQVADLYHETCAKYGKQPGRLMCSYFTHFADTKAEEDAQRARQVRYYKECVIPAVPGDPKTAPPSYRYFVGMVERLQKVKPEDLTENSVLIGSSARITETLKKVEGAGFEEVILYFNVGLKPHAQVKDEMARFMTEVAPAFAGSRKHVT